MPAFAHIACFHFDMAGQQREIIDAVRQDWQVTIRRACSALHFDRSTYHYQSRRTDPAILKKRIKEICETHVRYGYRRVYYILRRDGLDL